MLLITSDQQHHDTIGIDNPHIQTPALDRLAQEGVLFERAYCVNPTCSPSRSTMITGLYPSSHHCWAIGVKLPEDVPTVGEIFQANGYRTALLGKAHFQPLASVEGSESVEAQPTLRDLGFWRDFHGPWYGFEHVEVLRNHADESHVGQHYGIWMEENGLPDWRQYFAAWPEDPDAEQREHSWELPEEFHYSRWLGLRTCDYLEARKNDEEPFFLWTSFPDPHPPYLAPEPWASMYDPADMQPGELADGELDHLGEPFTKTQEERPDFAAYREEQGSDGFHSHLHDRADLKKDMAVYYGMLSLTDKYVGTILDKLDELDMAQDTLVVFTTDHGHFLGQHGLIAKGAFHFEDMVRIPMLVRLPAQIPGGRRVSALQSQVDFCPTILDVCGLATPGRMQGVSQFDCWRGTTSQARDHVIVEDRHQPSAVHVRTYIDDRYKLTVWRGHEFGELFDLGRDPGETRNLWDDPESQDLKLRLMHRFLQGEMERESTRMPRVAGA